MKTAVKYFFALIVGCSIGTSFMYMIAIRMNLENREEISNIYSEILDLLERDNEVLAKQSLSLGVEISVKEVEGLLTSSIFAVCNERTAKLLRKNEKHLHNKDLCK